jgi:rod shape determining protein RodA
MIRRIRLQTRDWAILVVIVALLAIGLAFIHSASYRSGPMGEGYYTSSPLKQVQWVVLGSLLFVGVLFVNYRHLLEHAYLLYLVGLVLLVVVLRVGVTSDVIVARRWLQVGPLRVQPSEIMKIFLILAMARYLMYRDSYRRFVGLFGPFALAVAPMLLIAKEPDLGTAVVLLPVVFTMLYVAAARARHLLLVLALFVATVPVVWLNMHEYQRDRVRQFLAQEEPHVKEQYHLRQSKAAIGSGGLFGHGLGKGKLTRYAFIPAKTRNNDFIYAVICEEWGFVGANAVLALFLLLFVLCAWTAEDARHPGGRLIAIGVVAMFATQVIINTAMSTGQLPIVGLTLPLISYGGSSLLSSLFGLALVVNVGIYRRVTPAGDDFDPEAEARRESGPMPEEHFMRTS